MCKQTNSRTFFSLQYALKTNCKIINDHIHSRKQRIFPHFLIQENMVLAIDFSNKT